jgi:hypothetical protein
MHIAEITMPKPLPSVALERVFVGDYLVVSDAGTRRALVSELADHNGYAAQNAEPGEAVLYYRRGDPAWPGMPY